tara:strand:- start:3763 stop:3948 length:186 start_codon:yes stop_codon:yes gene_type:complete
MSHDEASFAVAEQMGNSSAVTGSPTLDLTITEGGRVLMHRHCVNSGGSESLTITSFFQNGN